MTIIKTSLRNAAALLIAALISYIIGAILSSIFVLNALPVNVAFAQYISTAWFDIVHLQLYLVVILIGFTIAFPIAAALRKPLSKIAALAYPLAGATAIGVALGLMYLQFETVPISGARSAFGFIAQLIAGALGGAVFAKLQKPLDQT